MPLPLREPIEIHCPACGKPVTLWTPDPTLELAVQTPLDADLDAWKCPWCKATHPEDSQDVLYFAMSGHQAAGIRELLRIAEADSGTFPDECVHCHGAVMVRMTEIKQHPLMLPGSFSCPHCQRVNEAEFAGRIEWVRKGNEDPSFE
jgi:phage FluMu protein Com